MTSIIDGVVVKTDVTTNARGGTELMAERMVKYLDHSLLSQSNIVHSRFRYDLFNPEKTNILVLHDLPQDSEVAFLKQPQARQRFDKIVCVSDWQMQMYNAYIGLQYSEAEVIRNCIEPIAPRIQPRTDKVRLVYHTTPHRGLEILVPVFVELAKNDPNITLDVFSSFAIYGWEHEDQRFQHLFEQCKSHPQIQYHGSVDNQAIRDVLPSFDIFAYPCIWQETSCLAAIEALSAGLKIVCSNIGALPETTGGWAALYQYREHKQDHAKIFYDVLKDQISDIRHRHEDTVGDQKNWANMRYSVDNVMPLWTSLLENVNGIRS